MPNPPSPATPPRPRLFGNLLARRAIAKAAHASPPLPGLPVAPVEPAPAADGGIAYDPLLVRQLIQEHRELVRQFSAFTPSLEANHFEALPALLTEFKTAFDRHLLAENVRFYCYLEAQARRNDPGRREAIRAFRREMNEIARKVSTFVRDWLASPPDASRRDEFAKGLGQVGGLLLQRIRREEQSLYPLYAPPTPT